MQAKSDTQLLREYAEQRSEAAFGEIVSRHTDLVYSAALRQVASPDLARDVAQSVFTDLARKAPIIAARFTGVEPLIGWLYRSTRYAALSLLRGEHRRQTRERQAMQYLDSTPDKSPDWDSLRPVLDEAMAGLHDQERDALLLRFFKNQDFRAVGAVLGISDDAAQKRVARALEKLRTELVRRGVGTTAAALSAAVTANAVQAAPAGLTAILTSTSLAGAAAGTGTTITLLKFMAMTKLKLGIVSAIVVASVATPLVIQHQSQVRLRAENETLRQQAEQAATLAAENERLSNLVTQAASSSAPSESQSSELLRLRGEVARLRMASQSPTTPEPGLSPKPASQDAAHRLALAVAQGDPTALAKLLELAKAAHEDFNTNNLQLTDQQREELSQRTFGPLLSAFEVLTKEAAKGSQPALQALAQSISIPELKGPAVRSVGVLAGGGDENALNILLEPAKYNILLSSAVGALKPAADSGNQKAIDALAAVAADQTNEGLWFMAADGLRAAAASGNSTAIEALIALSAATNQSVRGAVVSGLSRAATNQNARAAEALLRMSTR